MTTAVPPVSLQINFAHSDLEEAAHVLPHQLRCWAGQVAEVVVDFFEQPQARSAAEPQFPLELLEVRGDRHPLLARIEFIARSKRRQLPCRSSSATRPPGRSS